MMIVNMIGGPAHGRKIVVQEEMLPEGESPVLAVIWLSSSKQLVSQLAYGLHTYLVTEGCAIYMGRRTWNALSAA